MSVHIFLSVDGNNACNKLDISYIKYILAGYSPNNSIIYSDIKTILSLSDKELLGNSSVFPLYFHNKKIKGKYVNDTYLWGYPVKEFILKNNDKDIFIICNREIFNEILSNNLIPNILVIYLTTTSLSSQGKPLNYKIYDEWVLQHNFCHISNKKYIISRHVLVRDNQENNYLNILRNILSEGDLRQTRNSETLSVFNKNLQFNLDKGFPLITSKKMFFKGIVEEFLFFIRGETDTKLLEEKGINIWKGNTSKEFLEKKGLNYSEGLMGPNYGYQWRHFNAEYNPLSGKPMDKLGIDQLHKIVEEIKNDPSSRRILLTSFNPEQVEQCVLYPCHTVIAQFYVRDTFLDLFVYIRSSDLFLGLPFNIASSALLLTMISMITSKKPGMLYITLGDAHIYKSHIDSVKEQINRYPLYNFPKLKFYKKINSINDIEKMTYQDFILEGYLSHPQLKAEMIP